MGLPYEVWAMTSSVSKKAARNIDPEIARIANTGIAFCYNYPAFCIFYSVSPIRSIQEGRGPFFKSSSLIQCLGEMETYIVLQGTAMQLYQNLAHIPNPPTNYKAGFYMHHV